MERTSTRGGAERNKKSAKISGATADKKGASPFLPAITEENTMTEKETATRIAWVWIENDEGLYNGVYAR